MNLFTQAIVSSALALGALFSVGGDPKETEGPVEVGGGATIQCMLCAI